MGKYYALFNFGDSLAGRRQPHPERHPGNPRHRAAALRPDLLRQSHRPVLRWPPHHRPRRGRVRPAGAAAVQGHKCQLRARANFAITGATALDTPYFEAKGLGAVIWNSGTLMTQIHWFRDLKPFFCNSTKECKDFFAKSLFVFGEFGGNDYNLLIFAGQGLETAYKFMPDVIQGISEGVEALVAEEAVDFIVPGVMPTGCFPVYMNMLEEPADGYGTRSGCVRRFNTFYWVHNSRLKAAHEKLWAKHPNVRFIYGDYYTPIIQFMLHPEKFATDSAWKGIMDDLSSIPTSPQSDAAYEDFSSSVSSALMP